MVSNSPVVITGSAASEMREVNQYTASELREVNQYSHDKPKLWNSCGLTPETVSSIAARICVQLLHISAAIKTFLHSYTRSMTQSLASRDPKTHSC